MLLDNIRRLCRLNDISVTTLERELGMGNGTIGKWAESSPRLDSVKKVADYFNVTLDQLVGDVIS